VKCIVRYGIGVNNVDLRAARELGVTVANAPNYCLEEVSNHALAMILSLCRRIPQDHHQIMHGGWGFNQFRPIPAFSDVTLGIVGFGKIGQRVARKAGAFDFRIIGFDPYVQDNQFAELAVEKVDWSALLKSADVISLHCPLVEGTKHLINQDTISMMKNGVILINTSRGPIVQEGDLIAALRSGKVLAAGLDVFEEEPLPTNSPLRGFSNVILTSHAAAVSEKAVISLQLMAAESARDFLQGKRPASVVV
jgi:D-3-phosphoglycerate dehydrogenase